MRKEVADYLTAVDKNKAFRDLERTRLPREDGDFVIDGKRIENFYRVETGVYGGEKYCEVKPMVKIDGVPYFIKPHKCAYSVGDIASTKMYREIGFKTPPVYTLRKYDIMNEKDELYMINQDVTTIGEYEFIPEGDLIFGKIKNIPYSKSTDFAPLYDDSTRELFQKYMTKECLNERMGLALNDTIRTEKDRHGYNLFYYKKKGAKKYEGIVPIDNEAMDILYLDVADRDEFSRCMEIPYYSATAFQSIGIDDRLRKASHKERIIEILDLLQSNKIPPAEVGRLKEALKYDLPKAMLEQKDNKFLGEYTAKAYEETARLWEYNRETIGKELGL